MSDIFFPQHLKRWTHPPHYAGEVWPAYYSAGVGQHRDSDLLERHNFREMLAAIGGESETVHVVRESHWAVGWVEWIAVHQDDETALRAADKMAARLADYPIANEDAFSEEEFSAVEDYWARCDVRERAYWIRRANEAGERLSIFAARRDYPPQEESGVLYDFLREGL